MSDTEEAPTPTVAVNAVNMKIPPYWPADPEVWFAQVEAQFATRGISVEKTKFDYIVASLSPAIATEVRDLILTPPRETPYTTLKAELTKRTADSAQRKLQQLLTEVELGDRKPTQLLRRMRQLGGDRTEDSFLRELFLQRLPNNVRMVLASSGADISLNSLANIADRIVEVSAPSIAAVQGPTTPALSTEMDSLRADMRRLQESVRSLSHQSRAPRRFSPSPVRRGSPSPSRQRDPSICWYHQNFGNAATKCRLPCRKGLNDQARR